MDKFIKASSMVPVLNSPANIRAYINNVLERMSENKLGSKKEVSQYINHCAQLIYCEVKLRTTTFTMNPTRGMYEETFPGYGIFYDILHCNVNEVYDKYAGELQACLDNTRLGSYYVDYIAKLME